MTGLYRSVAASISSAAIFISLSTFAGPTLALFSDDEARRAIIDLRVRVESLSSTIGEMDKRLQSSAQGQLQLLNENERLRQDIARLRGLVEETGRLASTGKNQQKDLYLDLDQRINQIDQRIKQVEPVAIAVDGINYRVSPAEKIQFEELRELLRAGEFKKTVQSAHAFQQAFPSSALSANVLLTRGTALYADKDYKNSILARQEFIEKFPNHPARPQATLNLAASQAESGNPNTARGILENLIKSFPNSSAAAEAKDRLKALPRPAAAAPAPAKTQQSK